MATKAIFISDKNQSTIRVEQAGSLDYRVIINDVPCYRCKQLKQAISRAQWAANLSQFAFAQIIEVMVDEPHASTWPFPTHDAPTAWTRAQERAYQRSKFHSFPDAIM